ncbi:FAD/NAD(P)-binding domain-containing protein [Auriculariales sp. MPI-PUGE-AT-0066]|nr:FAD/NAD(P)-binding domain-containing protein [Auriculariales sp. MPI-PUGE-AT-0066]
MTDTHFDVLILGTALPHSIAAAALAKAGLTVLHVDSNEHYGGPQAALTPDELAAHPWTVTHPDSAKPEQIPYARQYSISLAPAVVQSAGPFIDAIVRSGVSKYGSYKLLEALALYHPASGLLRPVPGNKEDIFRSPDLTLLEKRRLMKFLLFAAQFNHEQHGLPDSETTMGFKQWLRTKFGLGNDLQDAVCFALAMSDIGDEHTLTALRRIKSFIDATGKYGNSPFLVPYYGGLGEIAQGFCRTCAVHGGVYILGRPVDRLERLNDDLISNGKAQIQQEMENEPGVDKKSTPERWQIILNGVPDALTASVVLASVEDLPTSVRPVGIAPVSERSMACTVVITDTPVKVKLATPATERDDASPSSESPSDGAVAGSDRLADTDPPQRGTDATSTVPSDPWILEASTPQGPDDALIVFPPGSVPNGKLACAVRALSTGPKSNTTPTGRWLTHVFATDCTDSQLLTPYVDAVLQGHAPLHQRHFVARSSQWSNPINNDPALVLVDSIPLASPAEIGDIATRTAQHAFWNTMRVLRPDVAEGHDDTERIWPQEEKDADNEVAEEEW